MGLFSRDRKSAAENSPEAEIIADEQMVARVATLMNDFNAAVGSDSQMRATASAIASAAGLHDLKQAVTQPSMLDRPWRMLAAVATRSAQDGNFALAAQVFGFVEYWNAQIKPLLGPADWFELRLDETPADIRAEIAVVTLNALRQLPPDHVVFSNQTGTIHARTLVPVAAEKASDDRGW
jgi:hypothetical protein